MIKDKNNIDHDDLHAYVDGQLSEEDSILVERYLDLHSEDAAFVADLKAQRERLKTLFDNTLHEPIPERLSPHRLAKTIDDQSKAKELRNPTLLRKLNDFRWQSVAAVLSIFIFGNISGWLGHQTLIASQTSTQKRPMVRQALDAHTTYAVEVLHPVEVSGKDEGHLVAWLSKRLQIPVKAPKLKQSGYHLVGGRLLPRNDGVAAQLMYEDQTGKRITLYLIRNKKAETSAFRFASEKNMNAFYWLDHDVSYVLVGNITKEALSPLAKNIYSQMAS